MYLRNVICVSSRLRLVNQRSSAKCYWKLTESTTYLVAECTLWKIYCVCHSQDNQSTMTEIWSVKEIVHYSLIFCHQLIELVHQHHTQHTLQTEIAELTLQQVQCMRETDLIISQNFSQQRVCLMQISDFYAVSLNEYKVIKFVSWDWDI